MVAHKPTKPHIMSVFSHLLMGDVWTVMGENHSLAGRYTFKEQFLRESYGQVGKALDATMRLVMRSVVLEGDWAVVELMGQGGRLKDGTLKPSI